MLRLAGLVLAVLPAERIALKTPTESFTASREVVVHDGKLWWRAQPDAGTPSEWALIPPAGLPVTKESPSAVEAVSTDGDNVIAFSSDGRTFYAKLSLLEWTERWGPPLLDQPLRVERTERALAMSHRNIPFEDPDGNVHPVTAGVTTLYALSSDGRTLRYADPWLPRGFEHELCLPERGTLVAAALSASASTLFVMDETGHGYTRLADFDTVGGDPALGYSYEHARRDPDAWFEVRTLPGEPWRAQPPIPGPHTTRITILQTGATNAARELRVEGAGGYWRKALEAPEWTFVETHVPASRPMVTPGPPVTGPSRAANYSAATKWLGASVQLIGFDRACEPAALRFETSDGTQTLPLWFREGFPLTANSRTGLRGALLFPPKPVGWLAKVRRLFRGDVVRVEVTLDGDTVTLTDTHLVHVLTLTLRR